MSDSVTVDCEQGRLLGCQTYCCRLLVRLDADERETFGGMGTSQGFVPKDRDGYCIHLDRKTCRCSIWERRSRTCRGYTCNSDFLLQVAVRNPFKNIAELVRLAATAYIPKEVHIKIPSRRG